MNKFLVITFGLLFFGIAQAENIKVEFLTPGSCDPNPGKCKVLDQSGDLNNWECRNSPGHTRCYADVEYENGTKLRIFGSCAERSSDCWSSGKSHVDPCND